MFQLFFTVIFRCILNIFFPSKNSPGHIFNTLLSLNRVFFKKNYSAVTITNLNFFLC